MSWLQSQNGRDSRRKWKITFIHAPEDYYDQNYGTQFVPLWAYCLAAHVPSGWNVSIVDCKNESFRKCGRSDVFAFSGINQDASRIKEVWSVLKKKYSSAIYIIGGPITWSFEQEGKLPHLDYFDYLFILDGEASLPAFLESFQEGKISTYAKIVRADRFSVSESRKMRFDLFRRKFRRYYGGVIEVSRGCPFLCEFCDIRVLPDNNKANNKSVDLIIQELNEYCKLGITHIQFACDNFIGNPAWAKKCVDAIIAWKEKTRANVSIFTWLTINLCNYPDLMRKMRQAGFSILFIGIESVNRNSLLETAKIQNLNALDEAVKTIHSYGFVIAPGFIFGFDSDKDTVFDDTLEFFLETGMIGGDPSFLMALSGTPLYERMQRTDRLIEREEAVTRKKIQTNIRYLQSSEFLVKGFLRFIKIYTNPDFQLGRFRNLVEIIVGGERYVPVSGSGYGSPLSYLRLQARYPRYSFMLLRRIAFLLSKPGNVRAVLKGFWLFRKHMRRYSGLGAHFFYWVYAWTNIALKYRGLKESDFELHSVGEEFDIAKLVPIEPTLRAREEGSKHRVKAEAQARYTNRALNELVEGRIKGGSLTR